MVSHSELEHKLLASGINLLAGVDEAGRGPLAGPVVAASVIFSPKFKLDGVTDSKRLTAARRNELTIAIKREAVAYGIGIADHEEIDELNILEASILAMHRAIETLSPRPDFLLVDGNRFHHPQIPFQTVIKGDSSCFTIAAASILAKTIRDALMDMYDREYPRYGFARHKGYPTKQHIDAISRFGLSPIHRRSFSIQKTVTQMEIF